MKGERNKGIEYEILKSKCLPFLFKSERKYNV